MRRKRFLGFLPVFCLLALPLTAYGQNVMKLEDERAEYGDTVTVDLLLDADDQIQGLVAVIDWDPADGVLGKAIAPASPLLDSSLDEGADTVVTRVEDSYVILGVVMDSDPSDNGGVQEIINPASDILLATITLQAAPDPGDGSEVVTALTFEDGAYATVGDAPVLDNIVVVGGLSIGEREGLILEDGSLTSAPAPDKLIVVDPNAVPRTETGNLVRVPIVLDAISGFVEGFVVALCYNPDEMMFVAPVENSELLGPDASQADFIAIEDVPGGLTVGVVIDLIDPMEFPPNIPPAKGHVILELPFECRGDDCPPPGSGLCAAPRRLDFCDNVVGDPVKENLIVVGGMSVAADDEPPLVLESGTVTFCATSRPPPARETDCGLGRDACCSDGLDNDLDGLTDFDDPDCQTFDFEVLVKDDGELVPPNCVTGPALEVAPGEDIAAPLYLNSPDVNGDEMPDAVQGFSLVLQYPCDTVEALPGGAFLDIAGGILEANGAEFVGSNHTNPATPETGPCGENFCSVVLGVLVDATPPFDGQVIPGLYGPQYLGTINFEIIDEPECGEVIVIEQADCGAKGGGNTPAFNLVSVDNYPYSASVRPIEICVAAMEYFHRGDCNMSGRNGAFNLVDPVEIADAAAVISYLYGVAPNDFTPTCLDACDANDDGRINLTDAINILYFLFVPGTSVLPPPGPGFDKDWNRTGRGPDPTEDGLDCRGGRACDLVDPEDPGCPEVVDCP